MKKLLLALSTTALIFGLGACGGKKSTSTSSTSGKTSGTSQTSQTSQTSSQPGASSNSSEAGSQDTIYCKMEYSWWTADGAAIAIYMWNDADEKPAAWPGQRMQAVAGHENVWSFEANSTMRTTYPHIIFARVNASGDIADWGAKTITLDWPTGSNDLFTITNETESWGNPGCEGTWSSFGA